MQGSVLSAFFWGYFFSQVLGGYLSALIGGKIVIGVAMFTSAVLSLLSPIAANSHVYFFVAVRAALGFAQGTVFPAFHTFLARWAPPLERSVLVGLTLAGAQVGNVVVMPLSALLCKYGFAGGWPSIYYVLGTAGLIWSAIWFYFVSDTPAKNRQINPDERLYIEASLAGIMSRDADEKKRRIPWGAILTSMPVWAIYCGHFAADWGAYMMMMSLPLFMNDVLGFELTSLGFLSAVPYVANFVFINLGGIAGDKLRDSGVLSTVAVRRLAMLVAIWFYFVSDTPAKNRQINPDERLYIEASLAGIMSRDADEKKRRIPWGAILTSMPVWAIYCGHFAADWGAYMMMMSLPLFMNDVLGFELTSLGFLSAVPYVANFVFINLGGIAGDKLRDSGVLSTVAVRRLAMLVAMISQTVFLIASGYCGCGQEILVIIFLTLGIGLSGIQFAGYIVNYLDIAPTLAGPILGIGNTLSCIAGILCPLMVGALTPTGSKEEWQMVFWVTGAILVTGALIFSFFAKGEIQPWALAEQSKAVKQVLKRTTVRQSETPMVEHVSKPTTVRQSQTPMVEEVSKPTTVTPQSETSMTEELSKPTTITQSETLNTTEQQTSNA
ncbi:putative transporter C38C10.2 [Toxocara canis]|uniref:Putative transporter C38C10.2 n=1 Tax=Toxocara canis TaxID=6265 RepID=A0A0B2VRC1_TOXCA|nr:putative transporter C38C10.2 [Toxocara canis]